ncbi:MAG TPA: Asp23/Gls24 family envelope stress response protein [Gemmatimonadales bacterium]|nr:Asp23/Gls24 family envelope stress response protein [Gemmatimonadales bacterium]
MSRTAPPDAGQGVRPEPSPSLAGDVQLARWVAHAASAVPGVAGLSGGWFLESATFGPGDVVCGVRVRRGDGALSFDLHLIAEAAVPDLLDLARRVRAAVRRSVEALGAARVADIDIAIDDLSASGG